MAKLIKDTASSNRPLMALRGVVSVFKYLVDDVVLEYLTEISNDIRTQFGVIEAAYFQNTGQTVELVLAWDEWIRNHFHKMALDAQEWAINNIAAMRQIYAIRTDTALLQVMEDLADIEESVEDMFIDHSGLGGTG